MSLPETHICPNSISINVDPSSSSPSSPLNTPPTTIFFIPGNPGLISYYHTFLSLLSLYLPIPENGEKSTATNIGGESAQKLSALHPGFRICGTSLGGFETESQNGKTAGGKRGRDDREGKYRSYGLGEQIEFVEGTLRNASERFKVLRGPRTGSRAGQWAYL